MPDSSRKQAPLPPEYFRDKNALEVARKLLGTRLCTRVNGVVTAGIVTETEAYCAPEDRASHAWNHRKTQRTEVMYRNGGHAYVYLCYGIHKLFNVVCGSEGSAHAVLIRAIQPVEGTEEMMKRRNLNSYSPLISSGPGKLSQALGIGMQFNGVELSLSNGIWLEGKPGVIKPEDVVSASRIGIDYAGEWAEKPWRFYLNGSPWVSKR